MKTKKIRSNEDFSRTIHDQLKDNGIGVNDLAQRANIPRESLYKMIDINNPSNIRLNTLIKIANSSGFKLVISKKSQQEESIMAKMTLAVYRRERTEYLMDKFAEHADHAKSLTCAGYSFLQVHDAQIHAANVWNEMNEEGLLDVAVELYPQEYERLMDYKEMYREISTGVKP